MKEFIKYLLGGAITILLVLIIMLIPPSFFWIKDNSIVNKGKKVGIEPVDIQGANILAMTMMEKADMVNQGGEDIESVQLETGDIYSLYEARLQSFRELCKLPSLEMDIYGPVKDEIEMKPFLMIDAKTPSRKMIVWKGRLTIKEAEYKIILDEETGKIIKLESSEWENRKLFDQVLKDWEKYMENE